MNDVKREFASRARELICYVRYTTSFCDETMNSVSDDSSNKQNLAKTMKASCYLLVYNLVESTARNAVQAVFDHLVDRQITFDQIDDKLKLFVLKKAKRRNPQELSTNMTNIATDIFLAAINSNEFFSGDVDAQKLRNMANALGVSPKIKRAGNKLLTIKTNRNDLAHGHKSFQEIGRNTTVSDLRSHVAEAYWYLKGVLVNFCDYLDNERYRRI